MKITNEKLRKQLESGMNLELGQLNLLKTRTRSPLTIENLFKWRENPRWELERELERVRRECKGYLRHVLPAEEQSIREEYDEAYFADISRLFNDVPRNLRPEDMVLEKGVLSYTDTYRSARLTAATLELSDAENELYTALCDARSAVKLLRELCGSSLWSGDLEFLLFSEKSSEEIAFDYMTAERRRENFSHP